MATFAFAGGVTEVAGWGQRDRVRFIGTWAIGDSWTLQFSSTSGDFTLGAGNLFGADYNSLLTYGSRVYAANGPYWNYSAIDDPTGWEEQNIGAGLANFQTSFGFVDNAVALGVIQGRLAVFGRSNIQIWEIDADPGAFSRIQVLQNVGTVAPLSVQSIGELDLMFLDDTGIRSLRTRESTLNAYSVDIGSPVDEIVQGVLAGLTAAQKASACGVVEPTTKRYWLHLNGTIYVLSNYPLSEILAWATYLPTYGATFAPAGGYDGAGSATITGLTIGNKYEWTKGANDLTITSAGGTTLSASGEFIAAATSATLTGVISSAYTGSLKGQVAFTPEKMVVLDGLVYIRSTAGDLLVYGGTGNVTYDTCIPTVELPWLDLDDPTMVKKGMGLDVAQKGKWHVYASMNPRRSATVEAINRGSTTAPSVLTDSTFDVGHFPYSAEGTHVQMSFIGQASSVEQKIAKVSFLYENANKK